MTTSPPRTSLLVLSTLVLFAVIASSDCWAQGQGRVPHLAYAYPAGCERGMPSEIVVGGQFLQDVNDVHVSGDGVQVKILRWYRPLTAGEYNNLRMRLTEARELLESQATASGRVSGPTEKEVAEEAGITDYQLNEMKVYRQRDRDPRRQPNDQLEEQVTIQVITDIDVALGKREVRFLTDDAISNPIWIHLDKWVEHRESEPNDVVPADAIGRMPFVNNGQILPGDVDRFRFEAKKGMQLVVAVAARDVIPYLADAVPGWFQAVMRVTDELGQEVGFADSFHYRQDPVLCFEVPRDGRYTVEIRDALYRGREDFVYRVTVGEIPYVTSIFPLGGPVDSEFTVQLRGWNLKRTELFVKTPPRNKFRPMRWYSSMQGSAGTVRVPLQIDYWPEIFEQEPNDGQSAAQSVTWPTTINGRINPPGDVDVYRLEAGARMVAEVYARRLGSPLDSMLTLTDADGNELAFNDDHKDVAQATLTHHADSFLTASIPAGDEYFLHVSDAQHKGGEEFSYRLRLSFPQADYELRVLPSTIMARAGQVVPISVIALRKDGFSEDIEMSLVDPPEGFRLDGNIVPGGVDRVQMTLTVPDRAPTGPVTLEMEGAARRGSRSRTRIVRPAVPAENLMQAFIWYHLMPVEEWKVVVSGQPGAPMPIRVATSSDRITLPRGGKLLLDVLPLVKNVPADQLHVELVEAPEGITASMVPRAVGIATDTGRFAIQLETDADVVDAELRGNLLISVYKEVTPAATEVDPAPTPRRTDYGFMPAIPFQVSKRRAIR